MTVVIERRSDLTLDVAKRVAWKGEGVALGESARNAPGAGPADPLDRFSRRVVGALARALGVTALYPFGGPPHLPFQQWAQRAEPVHPSPIGVLIHPVYGPWHSYRGALGFVHALDVAPLAPSAARAERAAALAAAAEGR